MTIPPNTRTGLELRPQEAATRTYRCTQCGTLHVTCLRLQRCPECGAHLSRHSVQASSNGSSNGGS